MFDLLPHRYRCLTSTLPRAASVAGRIADNLPDTVAFTVTSHYVHRGNVRRFSGKTAKISICSLKFYPYHVKFINVVAMEYFI